MKRERRTIDESRELVEAVKNLKAKGVSIESACKQVGLYKSQYYYWIKKFDQKTKFKPSKKKTQLIEFPISAQTVSTQENIALIICRTPDIRSVLENVFGAKS